MVTVKSRPSHFYIPQRQSPRFFLHLKEHSARHGCYPLATQFTSIYVIIGFIAVSPLRLEDLLTVVSAELSALPGPPGRTVTCVY